MTGKKILIPIKTVLYVPDLLDRPTLETCRLLSMSRLQQHSKGRLQISTSAATIELPSGHVIPIRSPADSHLYFIMSKLYPIGSTVPGVEQAAFPAAKCPAAATSKIDKTPKQGSSPPASPSHSISISKDITLLHVRLGHQGPVCLRKTAHITGLKIGNLDRQP